PYVCIGEAFDVGQLAILRIEIIDGVARGQVLLLGRDRAVLDVDGERDWSHGAVDLRDPVVLHAVIRVQAVVDTNGLPQRVGGAAVQSEDAFSVRLVEGPVGTMDGDHADGSGGPLLDFRSREGYCHVLTGLHGHLPGELLAVHVDGQIR